MLFPLYFTSSVSRLQRFPPQTSQGTYTSGRKCISILMIPSPEQASQRPPFTLKLNLPLLQPFAFASAVEANRSRIRSNTPVQVAGLERGVRPIGDWSIAIILSNCSTPSMHLCFPGMVLARFNFFARALYKISFTRELLPEPDTPVTQVITPSGKETSIFFRLFSSAPRTVIQPVGVLR